MRAARPGWLPAGGPCGVCWMRNNWPRGTRRWGPRRWPPGGLTSGGRWPASRPRHPGDLVPAAPPRLDLPAGLADHVPADRRAAHHSRHRAAQRRGPRPRNTHLLVAPLTGIQAPRLPSRSPTGRVALARLTAARPLAPPPGAGEHWRRVATHRIDLTGRAGPEVPSMNPIRALTHAAPEDPRRRGQRGSVE
jgi:hypothetical protein